MTWPAPEVGQIVRYAYLWRHEAERGQDEGLKDRPVVIVITRQRIADKWRVVVAPITQASPGTGEHVVVNGHDAVLSEDAPVNGRPAHSISFAVGPVSINAHGNVDADTLQAIAATIAPVDDAVWAQLVAEAGAQA